MGRGVVLTSTLVLGFDLPYYQLVVRPLFVIVSKFLGVNSGGGTLFVRARMPLSVFAAPQPLIATTGARLILITKLIF